MAQIPADLTRHGRAGSSATEAARGGSKQIQVPKEFAGSWADAGEGHAQKLAGAHDAAANRRSRASSGRRAYTRSARRRAPGAESYEGTRCTPLRGVRGLRGRRSSSAETGSSCVDSASLRSQQALSGNVSIVALPSCGAVPGPERRGRTLRHEVHEAEGKQATRRSHYEELRGKKDANASGGGRRCRTTRRWRDPRKRFGDRKQGAPEPKHEWTRRAPSTAYPGRR